MSKVWLIIAIIVLIIIIILGLVYAPAVTVYTLKTVGKGIFKLCKGTCKVVYRGINKAIKSIPRKKKNEDNCKSSSVNVEVHNHLSNTSDLKESKYWE